MHAFTAKSSHVDCRSLWDNLQSNRLPEERNLWPDITFLKESYKEGTIKSHYWIDTHHMIANGLTKASQDPTDVIKLMHGTWDVDGGWKKAAQAK